MPRGIIIIPMVFIIMFRVLSMSLWFGFICLAFLTSVELYVLSPTFSATALQVPLTTKLPPRSLSPGIFLIGLLSPVSILSFTSMLPLATTQSAHIWSPISKIMRSPCTMLAVGTFIFLPSRTTVSLVSTMTDILSTILLAFIS